MVRGYREMLTSLDIAGFRSIREQKVDLAPLTVLYGPTASGKSSLLYAPLVLRNQVSLTTHSEVFVGAVLAAITRREIPADSVRFYLVEKEGKETVFRHQAVTEAGQIEGGMKTFIEGELEDIKALLGI
jgi:predicted ATPase